MEQKKFKLGLGGRELSVEIRDLAEQANGSAMVRLGDTLLLSTCVMSKEDREGLDFFPLTVEYEEKFYAAGKIRGAKFIRRESKPSDEAILTGRLIDRAIRPCFPEGLKRDVQVVNTCLSWDATNDPDILGLTAASVSLSISNIPWSGPVAAVRVGKIGNDFILNSTYEEKAKSEFDLVVTAVEDKNELLINMLEAGCQEVSEKTVIDAINFAKKYLKQLIDFQKDIAKAVGKEKVAMPIELPDLDFEKAIREFLGSQLENAIFQKEKDKRDIQMNEVKKALLEFVEEKFPAMGKSKQTKDFFEKETNRLVHENAIKNEKRPDGRKIDEIRNLACEVGLLPRTHGSGLFIRGQTKALSILTLGAPGDQQILDGMEIVGKKRFMLHYNFPPYSSGEIKPMRGPGRREIGHGMLGEKALMPLIPTFEEFPYTIRIVTEILSSNGSTSMASVSASSLALMDAGVPIKRPATGISIGLMSNEKGEYKILTDIQGPEDHYGDMDFKVAGTKEGITAIQMDVKIKGITPKIMEDAFERAKKTRLQILDVMETALPEPRKELSQWAPRIYILQINPDKIRDVIGPGGKVINEIISETGVQIDIEDTGKVLVTAEKDDSAKKAVEWIKNLTREVMPGEFFQAKIVKIMDFGAFAELFPGQDGLIHISQLANYRVRAVSDIVKVGDIVPVKVLAVDDQGKVSLSMKDAQSAKQKENN